MPTNEPTESDFRNGLYVSRLLTRAGDQAWDFALPLALIVLFPKSMQLGVGLFFLSKLIFALISPAVGAQMDSWDAASAVKRGIGLQSVAVVTGAALVMTQYRLAMTADQPAFWIWYGALTVTFVASGIGAMIMDIFVNQEVVSALFRDHLTAVNARVRQIDLATEVGAPVVTGLILAATAAVHPLAGFLIIVIWNVSSFVPEYLLLRPHCRQLASTHQHQRRLNPPQSIISKYRDGFRAFRQHRLAMPFLAYSMLWFSALSPHGVLLTTFLKGGWQLPESELGYFRAFGALFGVGATFLFPLLVQKGGLLRATTGFIVFQAAAVVAGLYFFGADRPHWYFLAAVLLSRIGLYGFIQGETELRQSRSVPGERGRLNGFGSALNQSATLLLFLVGTIFTNPKDFIILVAGSAFFVCLGATLFLIWARKEARQEGALSAA